MQWTDEEEASYVSPIVGMGCTKFSGSDRRPFSVVAVITGRKIVVQPDRAERCDSNGVSESQSYQYTAQPDAVRTILTLRKGGCWVEIRQPKRHSAQYRIGERERWDDPAA